MSKGYKALNSSEDSSDEELLGDDEVRVPSVDDDGENESSSSHIGDSGEPDVLYKFGKQSWWYKIENAHVFVQKWLARQFFNLGHLVGSNPYRFLLASVSISLILSTGVFYTIFDESNAMWFPHKSQAYKDFVWMNQKFGSSNATLVVIAEATEATSAGVLGYDVLQSVAQLEESIFNASVKGRRYFPDLCSSYCADPRACGCRMYSVLDIWRHNTSNSASAFENLPTSTSQVLHDLNGRSNMALPTLESALGGIKFDKSGKIVGAQAAMLTYYISNDMPIEEQWQLQMDLVQRCMDGDAQIGSATIYCQTPHEWTLETDRAMESDKIIFGVAIVLMLLYVSVVLGKFHRVGGRQLLSVSVVGVVGLSLGCGFGVAGFAGLRATQMSFIAIFVLLGVGVDDMFLLVDAFDRHSDVSDLPLRCAKSLGDIGSSILFTSVTDLIAFLAGSTLDLPAIHSFCITSGIAIFVVFCLTATALFSLVVLDQRRKSSNRLDLAPCVVSTAPPANHGRDGESTRDGILRRLMKNKYSGVVTSPVVSKIIPCVFLSVAIVAGLYGFENVETGFDNTQYLPSDSPLKSFVQVQSKFFGDIEQLHFLVDGANFDNPSAVESLCGLQRNISKLDFVLSANFPMWTKQYLQYLGQCWLTYPEWPESFQPYHVDPNWMFQPMWVCNDTFPKPHDFTGVQPMYQSTCLKQFLRAASIFDHGATSTNVRFDVDGVVLAAKLSLPIRLRTAWGSNTEIMDQSRTACDGLNLHTRAFTTEFLASERAKSIHHLAFQAISSTVIAVFAVSLLILSPVQAMLVTTCVIFVMLDLYAMMAVWDIQLNLTSVVTLCLGVGFSVDFSAHIAKAVSVQSVRRNKAEAVQKALNEQGIAVLHTGLSTLVAVGVLGFASSAGYHVLFRMMLGIVVLGVLHGMMCLPAALVYAR